MNTTSISTNIPYPVSEPATRFEELASDDTITHTAQALNKRGITTIIADTGMQAKEEVLMLIPPGSQVFTASSITLTQLGLLTDLDESGRYQSVRNLLKNMNSASQRPEMRRLISSPQVVLGSVQAVTQEGVVLNASMTGSQLPAYSAGAEKVIWIVGAQKIVTDIEEGFQRIAEYCLPLEDERTRKTYGVPSDVNKILITNRENTPGRITMILVRQNLGF